MLLMHGSVLSRTLTPEWRTLLEPTMHELVASQNLRYSPYPHIALQNFFSRRLYNSIIDHFPSANEPNAAWRQDNSTARCRRGGLCEQYGIGSGANSKVGEWPFPRWNVDAGRAPHRFWTDFYAALSSEDFISAWLVAFAPTLLHRYRKGKAQGKAHRDFHSHVFNDTTKQHAWARRLVRSAPLRMELGLRRSAAGYALEPHTDVCAKLISMVLTLPDEDDSADQLPGRPRYGRSASRVGGGPGTGRTTCKNGVPPCGYATLRETPYGDSGTIMYVPSTAAPLHATRCGECNQTFRGYTEVGRAPYEHNSMFAFASCATSWHGVASTKARRSIFFYVVYDTQRAGGKVPPLQAACPSQ
jgi:hypothetical protein